MLNLPLLFQTPAIKKWFYSYCTHYILNHRVDFGIMFMEIWRNKFEVFNTCKHLKFFIKWILGYLTIENLVFSRLQKSYYHNLPFKTQCHLLSSIPNLNQNQIKNNRITKSEFWKHNKTLQILIATCSRKLFFLMFY